MRRGNADELLIQIYRTDLGSYLHHLQRANEITGARLNTLHNLHFYLNLMKEMREAIAAGTFDAWKIQFKADRARGID